MFMCLAKSLIGRFQNEMMLHKENFPVIFLERNFKLTIHLIHAQGSISKCRRAHDT
jgi:hypothetical protein